MVHGHGELLMPARLFPKNQHLVLESPANPPSPPLHLWLEVDWIMWPHFLWKHFTSMSKVFLADMKGGTRTHTAMLCFFTCGMGPVLGASSFSLKIHKSIPVTFIDGRTQRAHLHLYTAINTHVKVLWWRRFRLLSRCIKFTETF